MADVGVAVVDGAANLEDRADEAPRVAVEVVEDHGLGILASGWVVVGGGRRTSLSERICASSTGGAGEQTLAPLGRRGGLPHCAQESCALRARQSLGSHLGAPRGARSTGDDCRRGGLCLRSRRS